MSSLGFTRSQQGARKNPAFRSASRHRDSTWSRTFDPCVPPGPKQKSIKHSAIKHSATQSKMADVLTLTYGNDTHTFPLDSSGARYSKLVEEARAAFALQRRPAGHGRAGPLRSVQVEKKAELTDGAVVFLDDYGLYTLEETSRSTRVDKIRWFESPQVVVETLVLGPPDEQSGSTLHATSAPTASTVTGTFQIYVKTLTGKTIPLNVTSSSMVEDVKRLVHCTEGCPARPAAPPLRGQAARGRPDAARLQHPAEVDDPLGLERLRGGMYDPSSAQGGLPKTLTVMTPSGGEHEVMWTFESLDDVIKRVKEMDQDQEEEEEDDEADDACERRAGEDDASYIARLKAGGALRRELAAAAEGGARRA